MADSETSRLRVELAEARAVNERLRGAPDGPELFDDGTTPDRLRPDNKIQSREKR